MTDVVIENPVIKSPFEEPRRHFVFDEDGITDEIAEERRRSSYFIPIPPAQEADSADGPPRNLGRRTGPEERVH